jgi:hypothetical protein
VSARYAEFRCAPAFSFPESACRPEDLINARDGCDDSKMRCLCVPLCASVPLWFNRDVATDP